ncbi:MAG TPA: hypothetical protein VKM36_09575 [Balneolaceae bacterium]|nr:hypothetical protein [Balneolaceae bacterium]
MKSFLKIFAISITAILFINACDGKFDTLVNERLEDNPLPDPVTGDPGSADFSNFITIGNSVTAGFMDAALYNAGQQNSLGAQLALQLQLAGAPETFSQPDINSERGFNVSVPNPSNGTVLGRFKLDTSIPGPSPTINGDPIAPFGGDTSSLNNFGVPGIVVGQLLTPETAVPGSPAFNPFYARFASSPGSSTILGDAVATQPTFFTLWIGSNDVLGYALSGATRDEILTTPENFQQQFGAVINTLMTNTQADGIVGTIPPILAIPFFRAVPYNVIELDEQTAGALNQGLSGVNAALDAIVNFFGHPREDAERRKISYSAGNNPALIVDPDLEDIGPKFDQLEAVGGITAEQRAALQPYVQARPMEVNPQTGPELLLLSAGQVLGTLADPNNPQSQIGVVIPLEPRFHLTAQNIVEIETARLTFNAMIEGAVNAANQGGVRLGIYDANSPSSAFRDIFGLSDGELGIRINGTLFQPDFSPNGVFSTDGVHPNQRGNAILANEFINEIENTFDASIPEADVILLPSVQLCAGDCVSQQQQAGSAPVAENLLLMGPGTE